MWNSIKRITRHSRRQETPPIPAGHIGFTGSKRSSASQPGACGRSLEDESTLYRAQIRSNSLRNPCALKSCSCSDTCAMPSNGVQSPQGLFAHYVAFHRDNTTTQWNGFFTCPLKGCLNSYESKPSLLAHIQVCERLSAGEYWCPDHHTLEQFLPASKTSWRFSWSPKGEPFRKQIRKLCSARSKSRSISEFTHRFYNNDGSPWELPAVDHPQLMANTPWSETSELWSSDIFPELETTEEPQLLHGISCLGLQELEGTQRQELPADTPAVPCFQPTLHPQYCSEVRESPEPGSPVSSLNANDSYASNASGSFSLDCSDYSFLHGQASPGSLGWSTLNNADNATNPPVWNAPATASSNQAIQDITSHEQIYSHHNASGSSYIVPNSQFSESYATSPNGHVQTQNSLPLFPYGADPIQQRRILYQSSALSPNYDSLLSGNNTVGNNFIHSNFMNNQQSFNNVPDTPPYTPPTAMEKDIIRNESGSNTSSPPVPASLWGPPISSSLRSPSASYTESEPASTPKRRLVPGDATTPRKRRNAFSINSRSSPPPSPTPSRQLPERPCPKPGCPHKSGGEKAHNQNSNLRRHIRTKHSDMETKWLCPECGIEITDRFDNLTSHWNRYHADRPPPIKKHCVFRLVPRTSQ